LRESARRFSLDPSRSSGHTFLCPIIAHSIFQWRTPTPTTEASNVGKRGMVVLPAKLRKRFGIEEGAYIIAEERDEGIVIRPAAVTPVEMYTPERVAGFLLGSAVDKPSYAKAVAAVRRMGLDPSKIDHVKPPRG